MLEGRQRGRVESAPLNYPRTGSRQSTTAALSSDGFEGIMETKSAPAIVARLP